MLRPMLLLALHVNTIRLASWCRGPHCAILNQLLELVLMLPSGLPYLRPSNLLLGALVHLPKLVPRAEPSAAAYPSLESQLAGFLVRGAPLRHPKLVAGAGTAAATGPPYLRPSNLLQGALVRLPKLGPGDGASAAACHSCAHPLAGVLVQGAPLRHPKSVAGA